MKYFNTTEALQNGGPALFDAIKSNFEVSSVAPKNDTNVQNLHGISRENTTSELVERLLFNATKSNLEVPSITTENGTFILDNPTVSSDFQNLHAFNTNSHENTTSALLEGSLFNATNANLETPSSTTERVSEYNFVTDVSVKPEIKPKIISTTQRYKTTTEKNPFLSVLEFLMNIAKNSVESTSPRSSLNSFNSKKGATNVVSKIKHNENFIENYEIGAKITTTPAFEVKDLVDGDKITTNVPFEVKHSGDLTEDEPEVKTNRYEILNTLETVLKESTNSDSEPKGIQTSSGSFITSGTETSTLEFIITSGSTTSTPEVVTSFGRHVSTDFTGRKGIQTSSRLITSSDETSTLEFIISSGGTTLRPDVTSFGRHISSDLTSDTKQEIADSDAVRMGIQTSSRFITPSDETSTLEFIISSGSTTLKPDVTSSGTHVSRTDLTSDTRQGTPDVNVRFSLNANSDLTAVRTGTNLTCTNDTDCPSSEACRRGRCLNLCLVEESFCPDFSVCSVTNHVKFCLCKPGYLSKECRRGIN